MKKVVGAGLVAIVAALAGPMLLRQPDFTIEPLVEPVTENRSYTFSTPLVVEGKLTPPEGITSFDEAEKVLRAKALGFEKEVVWVTSTGEEWFDAANAAEKSSIYKTSIDEFIVGSIMEQLVGDTIYVYHQHAPLQLPDGSYFGGIHPVSFVDTRFLNVDSQIKTQADRFGKKVVLRLVDQHGVWEYSVKNTQLVSKNLNDEIMDVLLKSRNRLIHEQYAAVVPIYRQSGVSADYFPFEE